MINQRMIAEKAGVSYATVSRAFTHSARVRPDTLQRIRNAMQELGMKNYDDLFLGHGILSKMVLVVVGEISSEFFAKVVSGIYEKLNEQSYSISLCISSFDAEIELKQMTSAAENGYAGIIMITVVETEEVVSFLRTARIPVVLVNRYIRSLDMDIVRIDNYRGGYLAASYLIEKGHRRIAHLSGPKNSAAAQDRLRGFSDALHDQDIDFDNTDVVFGDLSRASGRIFAEMLLENDYTAAFIANDYMTAGAAHYLIKVGRIIPQDISLICFDDSPIISADGLNITSISYDPRVMGVSAAETLLKRLNNLLGERIRIIYSPRINIRDSVAEIHKMS